MSQHDNPAVVAEPAGPTPSARRPIPVWVLALLLGIATLATYLPTLQNGFIEFDDPGYVTANTRVQSGLSWKNAAWAFSTFDMGNWHPLAWLSHMADCQLYGLRPAGHHATSILLHALCAVMLFLLLESATGFRWRSLMVAALFAVHPLNVETVAWVSERKSILSMLFSLCAIGLYGWYVRGARMSRGVRFVAVVVAFAFALFSKPMAVTLPVVLVLLDYWPLGRITFESRSAGEIRGQCWRLLLEKTPLFVMSAISSWVTILAQKRGEAISSMESLPMAERLQNSVVAYVIYIRRMLWPSDLSYFYPHRGSALPLWQAVVAAILLLAITGVVYRLRGHRPVVFGWIFFLVTLLPVIGILQVGLQSMADRYAYIPMIGLFIALAWELDKAASRYRVSPAFLAIAVILVVVLASGCTMITEGYWRGNLTLFARAHDVTSPPNLQIETNLAGALSDDGRFAEALVHYHHAALVAPNSFAPHYNLGYTLARTGDNAAAVGEFKLALMHSTTPAQKARSLNSLGIACLNLDDREGALAAFTQLLALQPNNAAARARIEALQSTAKSSMKLR
jgi:tetratricopeptide (TPR) repeat protein